MKTKDILLIIPAYNEQTNIRQTLQNLKKANVTDQMDVLVINDGSRDKTARIVQEEGFEVLSQVYNLGYGATLQTGYKYATQKGYDYLLQLDADGQHDVRNLDRLISKLTTPKTDGTRIPDIVIGSRFVEGSETFTVSKLKLVAITLFRFVIRKVAGYRLTDPTSGLMGLNKAAFSYYAQYTNFDAKYPDINMIVQMLLLGFHIEEIPAIMHERLEGASMHDGLLRVGKYMFIMALSTLNSVLRFRNAQKKEVNEEKA